MPSDSVAGFLDQARANRVLFPEQVEQLIRQPDIPQSDLSELCEYLEARGVLTRFQAGMLRIGRGHELTFAGYPVLDEAGPCPGGTAFRALHPSLRTPVVLRRLRADALAPADTTGGFIARARAAAAVHHPNLVTLLDAGFHLDEPYAAIDPPADATDLESLVHEIGPMPAFLAAEYGRQAAGALRAAHERGVKHGGVRPANLLIAPMTNKTGADGTVKRRPAPNAAVRVAELGLVPLGHPAAAALAYLPPERLDSSDFDPRGDLYGLGATLYYLLTGRPPFTGTTVEEVLDKVRSAEPAPLAALRPDAPAGLVELVTRLMAKRPDLRPPTAFDAEDALAKLGRPTVTPVGGAGPGRVAIPVADAPAAVALEDAPAAEPAAPSDEWSEPMAFSTAHASPEKPARKPMTAKDKSRTRLLIGLGLCLHLTATGFAIAWIGGCLDTSKKERGGPAPKVDQQPDSKPPQGPIRSPREREKLKKD